MYSEQFTRLKTLLEKGDATVGIIGLGYVGLPLAHTMLLGGYRVIGFDIDASKIEMLDEGRNYLPHLGDQLALDLSRSERFECSTDFSLLGKADAIVICVPTPLGRHQEPDLRYILNSARDIGRCLRRGQLIVLESTTYPGTTREDLLPAMLEAMPDGKQRLACGQDFFVAFSPEREDPGRKSHSTKTTPKLVGGLDRPSTELAALLYRRGIDNIVEVSSAEVAEAAKLHENIFRAVNIALVNEMKMVLAELGIDVWEVIRAAATKPFGFMPFFPGPGLGGHCIPIDPFYLTWKAKETGRFVRFIELAGVVNTEMPRYVIERTAAALNLQRKSLNGSRLLVLGLAYKPDVGDTRESPSYEIIEELRELGAEVDYSDPFVPVAYPVRKHELGMESVELTPENVARYDAVLVVTDHRAFDYALVAEHARLVIDTRDAMRSYAARLGARLVKA